MFMPRLTLKDDLIKVGRFFAVSFQRTLRLPDDGMTYPLPPGLGRFPLRRVRDYASKVPAAWKKRGGLFLPMYQREALWLAFEGPAWHPSALKVGAGGINAISGDTFDGRLRRRPQDYLVTPDQPWLDGINAGRGFIRQFVALPLGSGRTIEGQITGQEREGGIQLTVVSAKPGRFPTQAPSRRSNPMYSMVCESAPSAYGLGLGAGGRMEQRIYPDIHDRGTWEAASSMDVHVHIATTEMWSSITGEAPPPTPVSAQAYTAYGLPWFRLYDEGKGDLAPSNVLAGIASIGEEPDRIMPSFVDGVIPLVS
jgi:hypothetical protein